MQIPKQFKIAGQDYKVVIDEKACSILNGAGLFQTGSNQIILRKKLDTTKEYPRSQIEQTFLHELVHAILYTMNENDLFENERFVDIFATFLHQALSTQKGELK